MSEPPDEVRVLIRAVAEAGIAIQPTARVILGERDTFDWSLVNHPRFADVTPPTIVTWLDTEEGRWARRDLVALYDRLLPDSKHGPSEYLDAMNERVQKMLALYREMDVRVIFGSDTPAADGVGNTPGLNGYLEILAWADAGFAPEEILHALTLGNARALGLDGEVGSVEVGKRADLLVLARDPREDIRAVDSIELVIVRGEVQARDELSARSR